MTLTSVEQEKIFQELQKMPCGKMVELKSNLEQVGISSGVFEEAWDELRLVGMIKHGWDGLNNSRFKLTDFGKRYSDSILSFHETEERFIRLKEKLILNRS